MLLKRIVIICTLPSVLAGCAGLYGSQPPAPVYGGQPKIQKPSVGTPKKPKSDKEIVKTQPLKDFSEVNPEPFSPSEPASSSPVTLEALEPSAPTPPSPSELTPFQPIEATVPLSPVVTALVSAANQNTNAGDLDSAATSIERAIRIEPRNATLFYKLALLRLKQSKPRLAEDLAKKSALLAATDNTLKKHCWLLIAHAREIQQDFSGAKAARAKAGSF
ncbi:tetratricopeptide repeat protein [Methylobacter svalbardensis]|uniref:tetratricopeptide repeat protein n=1 Tax=Methylobacter svalbardensis TaxID=3080016 RepID=UPI0030ED7AB9